MTDFLKPFFLLRANVKVKPRTAITIDNVVFRQHYRTTSLLLFVASILVTSRQYIGEHIKCIVGGSLSSRVVSSYCFFTGTFSVENYMHKKLIDNHTIPHLGVGPFSDFSNGEIRRHLYYQWVPFFLFGQAIFFTLTHILWKKLEGGKLKAMLVGVQNAAFAFTDKDVKAGGCTVPSIEKKKKGVELIRKYFIGMNYVGRTWAPSLVICEILNVLNVILQFYATDRFLGGIFWDLGPEAWKDDDVLDIRFPKVSKCTFDKYGPSGTIQVHDVLCVMALNVINEKIFAFLWFWYVFLFILSILNVIWRFAQIVLHQRSPKFNHAVFSLEISGKLPEMTSLTLCDKLEFKNWLFFKYLGKNCDGLLFREIVNEVTDGIYRKISQDDPDEMYKLHQ